jgi:hypothetical protein
MIEWVPEGQTVRGNSYPEVMTKLREGVGKERLELWSGTRGSCIKEMTHLTAPYACNNF